MGDVGLRIVHPPPTKRRQRIPNAVLGTLIFILTEVMMFSGFISAYNIARSTAVMWPPPNQPRLPVEATAVTTIALVVSAALIWYAGRRFKEAPSSAILPFGGALTLGAFFLVGQGVEWYRLLEQGLRLTTSTHASFFYLIVGAHAVHVVGAMVVMASLFNRLRKGALTGDAFWAGRLFWYFVVGLWPILYGLVYV